MTALITAASLMFTLAAAASARGKTPNLKVQLSNTIRATWVCQDKIPVEHTSVPRNRSPWYPHSAAFRREQLNVWTNRLKACRAILARRAFEWNWQAWLPDKWRRIGVCETGLNWRHYNSSYEGAFGFATSSWDAFKPAGYPDHASQASPWQQYQVALAIWRRYGFSGWGCRNA